jgi:HlyD family secretion protein
MTRYRTAPALRRYQLAGFAGIVAMVATFGAWSAVASIHGAVMAPAVVVAESYSKKVQHKDGGIVAAILARDGDRVRQGQELVRLDDTETKAELGIVDALLLELRSKLARLEAQRDNSPEIVFPDSILTRFSDPEVDRVVTGQAKLFETRRTTIEGKKEQLRKQIEQLDQEIAGVDAQRISQESQLALIAKELVNLRHLFEQGLVPAPRILAMEREQARLEGERGQLIAERARAEGRIGEIKLQMIQIDEEDRAQTLTELRDVESRLAELNERRLAIASRLDRLTVRAPIAGDVYQVTIHTIGGVITPGETIMLVVPDGDELVLQAEVTPFDIDQVRVGQAAHLRFPAFDARLTPDIAAEVVQVAADTSRPEQGKPPFYAVRLNIPKAELAKLGRNQLKPGMPAEAFIETGERTPLSYFLKPLTDQIAYAFRES